MTESYHRPAEVQLPEKLGEMRESLLDGFSSRANVIRWLQKLSIRTLGQVPAERYEELAESFRPDSSHEEGVYLAAFLDEDARTRSLEAKAAKGIRQQWAADVIEPAKTYAFRHLRKDAGEYIGVDDEHRDDGQPDGYVPNDQTFAMRPALRELHTFQKQALERALDGLEEKEAILDWGDDLVMATRGEPVLIGDESSAGEFVPKLFNDPCGDLIMCDTSPKWRRYREWFLCRYVLPAFNRGVQDLQEKTAEEPAAAESDDMPGAPGWGD